MTRQYVIPVNEVKAGDTLIPDNDFTCIPKNVPRIVHQDNWFLRTCPRWFLAWFGAKPSDKSPAGSLYVNCAHGKHYLDSQTDEKGNIVGFIKAEVPVEEEETFGDVDYELAGGEAVLLEDIHPAKAGDEVIIMSFENGVFRLLDDSGNVLHASESQIKVTEAW